MDGKIGRGVWAGGGLVLLALLLGVAAMAGLLAGADRAMIGAAAHLRARPEPWLWFTRLGDADARIVACLLFMLLIRRVGAGWTAVFLLPLAAAAETLANSGLKLAFGRARPDLLPHLDMVTSLSFPSGHAAHTTALWLLAALMLAPGRVGAIGGALLVAALVGVSRVVLGVHWPSDVLGGWLFGAGMALIAAGLIRAAGLPDSRR